MAKFQVVKGATSTLCRVFLQDSSSTTGAGLTGLTSGSAGLVCYRARDDDGNAAATQITLSAGTRGTWSSGGFVEKDATNMPGIYEFGIPDAACATGSRSVDIMFKGATNLAPCVIEIELTNTNNQDGVHFGITALPNAAAGASGGLIINGANSGSITMADITVTGTAASGATPAKAALTLTGGAASTTGGGTAGSGLVVTGGAGAASTNGAAAGATVTGGGTNTVASNAHGLSVTGTSTGSGLIATSGAGATGDGIKGVAASTNGNGISGAGIGTGDGLAVTGGATGRGMHAIGGATSGAGLRAEGTAGNSTAIEAVGQGSAAGTTSTGGATGHGISAVGGATSGDGINATATTLGVGGHFIGAGSGGHGIHANASTVGSASSMFLNGGNAGLNIKPTNGHAIDAAGGASSFGMQLTGGSGNSGLRANGGSGGAGIEALGLSGGNGLSLIAGATGTGLAVAGGPTSGAGVTITTTSGDGVSVTPTAGNALVLTANGTSKHGAVITGGTAGTSDGAKFVAGTGGVPIRGDLTGNITGNLSGSVGSVTARVTANVDQFGGSSGTFASGRPEVDLNSSATTELAAIPTSTAKLKDMIQYVYMLARNKITQTSTTSTLKANDGTTNVGTSAVSDDGTTFTRGGWA